MIFTCILLPIMLQANNYEMSIMLAHHVSTITHHTCSSSSWVAMLGDVGALMEVWVWSNTHIISATEIGPVYLETTENASKRWHEMRAQKRFEHHD